ncbi:hypothetical protein IP81_18010 [Novosphingobium sp. AAP83]|uniref:hypothetical protein n=1 Tax=Novosphingobium sp. AAP83 TaxID=1523425 RepID=UPI0006CCC334|nr:hypothetical protein [Novosphingobium sp. AAP83]KPF88567.1 hypothetical protein IP81_18010 [Novosphingobium sp. AAP83]
MTETRATSLWEALAAGNIWWPSYKPGRDTVLSWRHAAAILMRDIDPQPIFAALPAVFGEFYDLSAAEVREQLPVPDGQLLWPAWLESWVGHFDHWHDPVRQLVEQHCITPDARVIAGMLARLDGAAFCDFVLQAYERAGILGSLHGAPTGDDLLPIVQTIANAAPFERLSYGLYQRFCSELNQEAEPPLTQMSGLDFDWAGNPNIFGGDVT